MRSRPASRRVVGLIALLTLALGGCKSQVTGPLEELSTARARWSISAPASYTFVVARSCECLAEMAGPVVVSVRNRLAESRHYTGTGVEVPASYAGNFPTIEAIFAVIDAAVRDGTQPIDVQYDPALGYPTRVSLGDTSADGGTLFFVSQLRAQ
ncbi:MAG: DUF6174 domain-containing protein [Gemmatimonadaceae bacterium]